MTWLSTVLSYVKKYWGIAALVVGAIVAFFLFKKQDTSFSDRLKQIQDAHDVELKQIQDARDEEEREHQANEKRLKDTLDAVQQQYDAAQKDLDDKKRQEVEDLVRQYGDDPDALAKKLSEATGFTVVLPS